MLTIHIHILNVSVPWTHTSACLVADNTCFVLVTFCMHVQTQNVMATSAKSKQNFPPQDAGTSIRPGKVWNSNKRYHKYIGNVKGVHNTYKFLLGAVDYAMWSLEAIRTSHKGHKGHKGSILMLPEAACWQHPRGLQVSTFHLLTSRKTGGGLAHRPIGPLAFNLKLWARRKLMNFCSMEPTTGTHHHIQKGRPNKGKTTDTLGLCMSRILLV